MNFFIGAQLAVAIEDLATDALLYSEEILEQAVVNEILTLFPISPTELDRKLVNGFMRGSTSIKREQLIEGIQKIQGKFRDDRNTAELVELILDSLAGERKEIHLRRTQKSAVKQILRALNEDLWSVPTVQEHYIESFVETQKRLREQELRDQNELMKWADSVEILYAELFVGKPSNENLSSRKQKGIVTFGAAKSYMSVWSRFIGSNSRQLMELATEVKLQPLIPRSSPVELSYVPNAFNHISSNRDVSVTIKVSNSGQNKFEFTRTWNSKESAREGLIEFISALESLTSPNERIDFASLQINDDEMSLFKIEEATAITLQNFFSKLL